MTTLMLDSKATGYKQKDLVLRVLRGVAVLDETVPGWHKFVDPQTLNMSDGRNCVLGQLFAVPPGKYVEVWTGLTTYVAEAGYNIGQHVLAGRDFACAFVALHGFEYPDNGQWGSEEGREALRLLWLDVLAQRNS